MSPNKLVVYKFKFKDEGSKEYSLPEKCRFQLEDVEAMIGGYSIVEKFFFLGVAKLIQNAAKGLDDKEFNDVLEETTDTLLSIDAAINNSEASNSNDDDFVEDFNAGVTVALEKYVDGYINPANEEAMHLIKDIDLENVKDIYFNVTDKDELSIIIVS